MKQLILALLVFCGTLTVQSESASASGATVVFLLHEREFKVLPALQDQAFRELAIYSRLESSVDNILVARVAPHIYRDISYVSFLGCNVALGFENYKDILFRYYPEYDAILGMSDLDEYIVLLQQQ